VQDGTPDRILSDHFTCQGDYCGIILLASTLGYQGMNRCWTGRAVATADCCAEASA
jgi:hypothetical protein